MKDIVNPRPRFRITHMRIGQTLHMTCIPLNIQAVYLKFGGPTT